MKFQMNHILPALMGATFVERSAAAWFITKTTPSTIAFGDDGESEIVATFNVSSDQASSEFLEINFLEADTCNTTTYDSLSGNVTGIADTDNADYKDVSVGISIDKDTITESGAWNWTNATFAELSFCTRVDLVTDLDFGGLDGLTGPIADVLARSVGYVKVMYGLDIDMSTNFEVSIAAEETEALTDEQATTVTYDVIACQCTLDDKVCLTETPALSQNSLLNICVYPEQDDIIIRSLESFALEQGDLAVTFVSGTTVNALTTVSPVNQKTISISTVLISAFFLNPSPVTAAGMVVLTFGDTDGARQLSVIESGARDGRQMQAAPEDGTGTFDVEATLVPIGEEVKEVQAIDESSAMLLSIFNGGVAAFAMASAMVGLM